MRLSLAVLLPLIALSACQAVEPATPFRPLCTHRAIDAGRCEQPSDFHLFDLAVGRSG